MNQVLSKLCRATVVAAFACALLAPVPGASGTVMAAGYSDQTKPNPEHQSKPEREQSKADRDQMSDSKPLAEVERMGLDNVKKGDFREATAQLDELKKRCGENCKQYKRLSKAINKANSHGG